MNMKRKLFSILAATVFCLAAHAQFEAEKMYANASLSGLNLHYNGLEKLNLSIEGKAGYLIEDNWMLLGQAGYNHYGSEAMADNFTLGAGVRYYIVQNGIYLGVQAKWVHANHNYNDFMPGIEIGYAFFISRTATIEPAIYYDQSLKSHRDYSTIGFKIGFGLYL